jgi:hypothetical protein
MGIDFVEVTGGWIENRSRYQIRRQGDEFVWHLLKGIMSCASGTEPSIAA